MSFFPVKLIIDYDTSFRWHPFDFSLFPVKFPFLSSTGRVAGVFFLPLCPSGNWTRNRKPPECSAAANFVSNHRAETTPKKDRLRWWMNSDDTCVTQWVQKKMNEKDPLPVVGKGIYYRTVKPREWFSGSAERYVPRICTAICKSLGILFHVY